MTTSIFEHISFFTLDEEQKSCVRAFAQAPTLSRLDSAEIFKYQAELSMSVAYWDDQVNKISQLISHAESGSELILSGGAKRNILKDELTFALYIFYARYQLAFDEGRGHDVEEFANQFVKCFDILNKLNELAGKPELKRHPLPAVFDDYGVNTVVKKASVGNERRLYWVWAGRGGVLGSAISLLPDHYYHKTQALNALDLPVPLMGTLSWALYYWRGSVKLGMALRNAMSGPKNIPFKERLVTQLDNYKFDLLNDYVWATGNLACFFWLYGSLDYYGGVATTLLLMMDASLAVWGYREQRAQFIKDMTRLDHYIATLKDPYQLTELNYIKRQCKLEWDYKLYGLIADIMYAVLLMASFCLLYSFFLPSAAIAVSTAVLMGATGTALCFSFNAFFAAVRQVIDICKSVELTNYAAKDHAATTNYFDLKLHEGEWHYHQKLIDFKTANLVRSVVVDLSIPPLVFVSFVFMPLCIAVPVVTAGFTMAVLAYYGVDAFWGHEIDCLPAFKSPKDDSIPEEIPRLARIQGFFARAADCLEVHREENSYAAVPS